MKCRKYQCVMTQKACLLRREMIELLRLFNGSPTRTFFKCESCTQGEWIQKNYPVPGLDNDVFKLMVAYKRGKLKKVKIFGEKLKKKNINIKLKEHINVRESKFCNQEKIRTISD